RMAYIQAAKDADDDEGCIFCDLPAEDDDERTKILSRGELAFAILNSYPYNPGHLMVAPFRHVGEFGALEVDELAEVDALIARSIEVLGDEMQPHGYNLGMNLGRVAGAGIPGHVHWHVVPRWNGDTNFMPVVGQTRVLPELLEESVARLRPRFEEA
ncbi:MAG TPA: HIT domain-containing protein, partial [Actinomycetota bacterium]|nr:HIT domain-containing protein [Actinomycetota bacterium]